MENFNIELCLWEIESSINQIKECDEIIDEYKNELREINKKIEELLEILSV